MYLTVQVYCKCQSLAMEKFDKFDEWLGFVKNFPYKPLLTSFNVSPMKPTINLSVKLHRIKVVCILYLPNCFLSKLLRDASS